jgi:hypothetical protein
MTDQRPSPFTLTRARIILLVLGALAVTMIIGAIMGGVSNYNDLRNARDAALTSSETTSAAAN